MVMLMSNDIYRTSLIESKYYTKWIDIDDKLITGFTFNLN